MKNIEKNQRLTFGKCNPFLRSMKMSTIHFSLLLFLCSIAALAQPLDHKVVGFISHMGSPLEGAKIALQGTDTVAFSDTMGRYEILAGEGATLRYEYPGMEAQEIIVEDVTYVLNINMRSEIIELEEVTVSENRLSRQEKLQASYLFNKNIIKTAYGYLDSKVSAYNMMIIDEEDLSTAFDLEDVIKRKIASATAIYDSLGGYYIRLRNSSFGFQASRPAGFDIDGFVTTNPPIILPSQIKRIAIIRGPAAYGKYGVAALGGMIIINMKSGQYLRYEEEGQAPYDYAMLRNNLYTGDAVGYDREKRVSSTYEKRIFQTVTAVEARQVYGEELSLFGDKPDFHFYTAAHFLEVLNDEGEYLNILEHVGNRFKDNANILKALAYIYEDSGHLRLAAQTYERIFTLRPKYAQSYRDLANIYNELGKNTQALNILARYKREISGKSTNTKSEIDSIMNVEAYTMLEEVKLNLSDELKGIGNQEIWPIRLLFEWSNAEAEFDIQLVNPANRHYTWSHTLEKNKDLIIDEKQKGYSSKQFYMGSEPFGKWKINLSYYGNKSYDNTYFKVTSFSNYGSYLQTKKVSVYKFSNGNASKNLNILSIPVPMIQNLSKN